MTADVEYHVDETHGLRTFGVTRDGWLTGLTLNEYVWSPGVNTATCRTRLRPEKRHSDDLVPKPDCHCGFYAYTHVSDHAPKNRVEAVVACRGRQVVGELGVRAESAKIEALVFGENVPWVAKQKVEANYPGAKVYSERTAMLSKYGIHHSDIANPGTFHGFKPHDPYKRPRLPRWTRSGKSLPAKLSRRRDFEIILDVLKGTFLFFLALMLVAFTAEPALVWIASGFDQTTFSSLHQGVHSQWSVFTNALDRGQITIPWGAASIYLAFMNATRRTAVTAVLLVIVGTTVSALTYASLVAPPDAWNATPAFYGVLSITWLMLVLLTVLALVRISWGRHARESRRLGRNVFVRIRTQWFQDIGIFTYVPETTRQSDAEIQR